MLGGQINVTLKMDHRALEAALVQTAERSARRGAGRIRDQAKRNIRSAGRVDTGALMQSIQVQQLQQGPVQRWKIYSPLDYATYQHEGVRPFGPRRAKVLRWRAKGGGGYVFSTKSSGFPGSPFLKSAAEQVTIADFVTR